MPWPQNIESLVGNGAVLVMDHHASEGSPKELYALNADQQYLPASIIKIVTCAAALEFFGPDFRFKTDFLYTKNKDLWVIGYGDPYLVSEELIGIVETLKKQGLKRIRNIYIDNSYFEPGLILDGNTQTARAYDAYNTAFGVNFNTVSFRKNKKGHVLKKDPHIPVTDLALKMAGQYKKSGSYTLNIESPAAAEIHAGQIFKAHLEEAGIKVSGQVITGRKAPQRRKIFYGHESSRTLRDAVRELMEYSNNFMTNQIFLALGAEMYGAPASWEKSQKAMDQYFNKHGLEPIIMGDGSGLSRQTTLSARQMSEILKVAEDDRMLLSNKDNGQILYKTGTMSDVKNMAGYLQSSDNPKHPLSFVILLNGQKYNSSIRDQVLDIVKDRFLTAPSGGL